MDVTDQSQVVKSKLIKACTICAVFMCIEFVAGYIANSLALMTDAVHLLSDLSSFIISLFAIWVATLPGTSRMSFGYHRAEILGALLSVLLIWIITGGLCYEAVGRMRNPPDVDGSIMFGTAVVGTMANVIMTYILGMHSHGIGGHDHDHGHHNGCSKNAHHVHRAIVSSGRVSAQITPRVTLDGTPLIRPKEVAMVETCDGGAKLLPERHTNSPGHSPERSVFEGSGHFDRSDGICRAVDSSPAAVTEKVKHDHQHGAQARDCYVSLSDGDHDHDHGHGHGHDDGHHDSINLRAAYIHAVGDLIQNIGVMIAAGLIWWRPSLKLADPICTLMFSVFVLITTGQIIREATNVLMEGTPPRIDLENLITDLAYIKGVSEIHDLHVWSLSIGKPSLACHLVIESDDLARQALKVATQICQKKYDIQHTTIQIDFSHSKASCDTDAHAKCHLTAFTSLSAERLPCMT